MENSIAFIYDNRKRNEQSMNRKCVATIWEKRYCHESLKNNKLKCHLTLLYALLPSLRFPLNYTHGLCMSMELKVNQGEGWDSALTTALTWLIYTFIYIVPARPHNIILRQIMLHWNNIALLVSFVTIRSCVLYYCILLL